MNTDIREADAQSIETFCERNGISRALFYILQKGGNAPRVMKVGTRTLISAEAAQEWRRRMEVPPATPKSVA